MGIKLGWMPRTSDKHEVKDKTVWDTYFEEAIHKRLKGELKAIMRRSETLLALAGVQELFDQQEQLNAPVRYLGSDYVAYTVDTGDEASELLKWWSKQGWLIRSYTDNEALGTRDYRMYNRDNEDVEFRIYMYFGDNEGACRFEDEIDPTTGEKVVDYIQQAIPAQAARPVYKRKLMCGGSAMPTGGDEG